MASTFVRIGSVAIALAEEALDSGDRAEWRKQSTLAMSALNYAREHAAEAAKARRDAGPANPHRELLAALGGPGDE